MVEQTVIPLFTGKRERVCKHIFWHIYFEMTGKGKRYFVNVKVRVFHSQRLISMLMWERWIVTVTQLSQTMAMLPMTQYAAVLSAVGIEKKKTNNICFLFQVGKCRHLPKYVLECSCYFC